MARKPIPADVQMDVLTKCRRRCCLCFWLDGKDEVQKGQIAHLDGDNENAAEDNLTFLCFVHHDDYDSTTRIAKGLRDDEVKHWRNELHREMEFRFRTVKKRSFELSIVRFKLVGNKDCFSALFRFKNTGDSAARSLTITIRLPEGICGDKPEATQHIPIGTTGEFFTIPSVVTDVWAAYESRQDIFESDGRVALKKLGGMNPILMAGHSFKFEALTIDAAHFPLGADVQLEYRVDAEDMPPFLGNLSATIPPTIEELLAQMDEAD